MHTKSYFLHNGEEQTGPYSFDELKQIGISNNSHIWYDGLENWKRAEELNELKELISSTPPKFNQPIPPPIKHEIEPEKKEKRNNKAPLYISGVIILVVIAFLFNFISEKKAEVSVQDALQEQEYQRQIEEQQRIENEKLNIRTNLDNYFSVKHKDYSVDRLWGGITDLYFDVTNKTNYSVDVLTLEIRYIRGNGGLFKTEQITFTNIPPLETITLQAPNSNKGQRVEYNVVSIFSSTLNLCFEKDKYRNSTDPYKCD